MNATSTGLPRRSGGLLAARQLTYDPIWLDSPCSVNDQTNGSGLLLRRLGFGEA